MEGLILARDRPDPVTFVVQPDHVLGVSPPALLLSRLTVRQAAGRVLDLGCGGGVQALLAARHAESVVGVDLNPRALAFARFNARLNGVATSSGAREISFPPWPGSVSTSSLRTRPTSSRRSRGSSSATAGGQVTGSARASWPASDPT